MARPRAAVSAIAASTVSTPASAAAVSSPTLCPVMTTSPSACGCAHRARAAPPSSRATNRLIATTRGWVTAVSLIASASPVVPRVRRSAPAMAPAQRKKDSGAGQLQPVGEHSGFLRALSGGEDGQHPFTVPVIGRLRGW